MAGELVVGYDGLECAQTALRVAAGLAKSMEVGLIIVFAAEPPQLNLGGAGDQRRLLAERGAELLDEAAALEQLLAIRRAGADFILTYFARTMAELFAQA